ncbi:MAG: MoaD/ThiS family protein [Planctomycetota bacterium]|nr:MoaD/ThiS family protein [Planctomycetota bacterium]
MKITLQYFGQLRHLAGRDEQPLDAPPAAKLPDLLASVAKAYEPAFGQMLLNSRGQLSASLLVLVNDEAAPRGQPPALAEGDRVALIPPIAGG